MDFKMHRGGKGVPPGSIANYVTGVSECSQQRGNLKDDGYKYKISPERDGKPDPRYCRSGTSL
ncbi:hypothetical protein [Photorhabdus bodei]|uniref:hypothetical protein n=1 Tax=Photorhabdus bodei TaxID=2029681 RepID=UPI001E383E02|nr:hypothetical protein [Photorhabdus bodei]MCC8466602.1 hypothetical protein [Photorhabdus bodei]